ncbi:hypothetical protein WDW86_10605 [Bdellovibrionota bacterium FG-2]
MKVRQATYSNTSPLKALAGGSILLLCFFACAKSPQPTAQPLLQAPIQIDKTTIPQKAKPKTIIRDVLDSTTGAPINPKHATDSDAQVIVYRSKTIEGPVGKTGPAGPAGPEGRQGNDGQDACGIETFSKEFFIRPLRDSEFQNLGPLPYVSTLDHAKKKFRHKIRTLNLGEMTGRLSGTPFVRSSQVVFAVDLTNIPPQSTIRKVNSVTLKLGLTRVVRNQKKRSELLCLLNERLCSGAFNLAKTWQDNVNEDFFKGNEISNPINAYFSDSFANREIQRIGKYKVYSEEVTLDLEKLTESSPLPLLYGKTPETKALDQRTILMSVADDTFVSNEGALVISMDVDTCN